MAKKIFVLDTNVLLSDPGAIYEFGKNQVVIPLMVIEELDNHKTRADEVGRNARETVRKIESLIKGKQAEKGVSLPNGGVLKILSIETVRNGAPPLAMPQEFLKKTGDNSILELCAELETVESDPVVLVSKDLLMRIKASTLDIVSEDYGKLPSSESGFKLYDGVAHMEVDFDLNDLFTQGFIYLEPTLTKDLNPNQFIVLKNGTQSALVRFHSAEKAVTHIKDQQCGKVSARNKEQNFALDLLTDSTVKLVSLAGFAGTGKTLIAIAAGLEQVMAKKYKTLIICRPIQSVGKEIGFLPGTIEEKMEPWIAPIKDNLRFLLGSGKKSRQVEDSIQLLFEQGTIEIQAMSFIRGRSIAGAYIIIDEAQNLNLHELKTIITRVGENTKIVLTGDTEQIDNGSVDSLTNGLTIAVERFKSQPIAGHVTLTKGERSELATIAAKIL